MKSRQSIRDAYARCSVHAISPSLARAELHKQAKNLTEDTLMALHPVSDGGRSDGVAPHRGGCDGVSPAELEYARIYEAKGLLDQLLETQAALIALERKRFHPTCPGLVMNNAPIRADITEPLSRGLPKYVGHDLPVMSVSRILKAIEVLHEIKGNASEEPSPDDVAYAN